MGVISRYEGRARKVAIAGLSMGGYGALRLGAKYAPNFSAISAHSAITELQDMFRSSMSQSRTISPARPKRS
jgi:S-formylglutathione hydrolase FrmB